MKRHAYNIFWIIVMLTALGLVGLFIYKLLTMP